MMQRWMTGMSAVMALGLAGGCGDAGSTVERVDAIDACFTCAAKADALGGVEAGTYEAAAVLSLANTLSLAKLDDDVALDARAASGIVDARPFADLAELDAVPYVGPSAVESLLAYAADHGRIGRCGDGEVQPGLESCDDGNTASDDACGSTCQSDVAHAASLRVHGVLEGSYEAMGILMVANSAGFEQLDAAVGLDARAATAIVEVRAARPFASLTALDSVSWVGARAFERMLDFAQTYGLLPGCGDGVRQPVMEQCDDGNHDDGDGCSASCAVEDVCDDAEALDQLIEAVNAAPYDAGRTREIRRDLTLADVLDEDTWPAPLTSLRCFGVDADLLPDDVEITAPEDNRRLLGLLRAFAQSAASVDPTDGVAAASCQTRWSSFHGCRLDFRDGPFRGAYWNYVASDDGTALLFAGTWSE